MLLHHICIIIIIIPGHITFTCGLLK